MKKALLFLTVTVCCISATYGTIIKINVSDFQFKPKSVNAKLGDTVQFQWKNGIHTTSSLTIPVGAAAWDALMDSAHKKFKYKLTKTGVYNYQCNIHFTVMKGKITVTTPLAAGLSDLTISDDFTQALLSWNTFSSKDIASFSVQKSTDGENFTEIQKVNPSATGAYKITDKTASTTKYIYYQVEMTDIKGNHQLSPIQMYVNNHVSTPKLVTSISPNPISKPGHLMLQFNADKEGTMLVKLYSQTGNFVKQAEMSATKGLNNAHFHMGDLTPGAYYIVCTLGNITEKHTIVMK